VTDGGGRSGSDPVAHRVDRARGSLLGLAIGDALGRPAENLTAAEIVERFGRITGYVDGAVVGTDDTEFAIFSGQLLIEHGANLTIQDATKAWRAELLGQTDSGRAALSGAGFSTTGALLNLERGLVAPESAGHAHAWSDELAMRAAVFGVFAAGDPLEAARLAAIDGAVAVNGEGIYGGVAVAAGVSVAMALADTDTDTTTAVDAVFGAAIDAIPADSWTARNLEIATSVTDSGSIGMLLDALVARHYPWTDLGPEAVGLAFAAIKIGRAEFVDSVLAAVNMGRDADTTAAIVGSICGAIHGESAIPREWLEPLGPATGRCLGSVAGVDIADIAELLVARSAT